MTGPARADVQGSPDRRRRGARHLQGAEVRHDCRLHGHRGPHHARRRHAGAPAARQRRGLRRQDRLAAPLQGRRQRGQVRLRVRHRLRASSTTSRSATSSKSSRWSASRSRLAGGQEWLCRLMSPRFPSRPRRRSDPQRARARCSRARCTIPGIGFVTLTRVQVTPGPAAWRASTTRRSATTRRAARPRGRSTARRRSCAARSARGCG